MSEAPDGGNGNVFALVERRKPVEPPWSPEQMVANFLDEIRSGAVKPTNLMVFFLTKDADGRLRPETWSANVSHVEAIAFCQLEIARALEDWRK